MEKFRISLKAKLAALALFLGALALLGWFYGGSFQSERGTAAGLDPKRPAELARHVAATKSVVVSSYPRQGIEAHDVEVVFADGSVRKYAGITDHTFRVLQERYLTQLPADTVAYEIRGEERNWPAFANLGIALLFLAGLGFLLKSNLGLGGGSRFEAVAPDKLRDSFDSLVGMEDIKDEIRQILDIVRAPEVYRSHGIARPMNMLFTGPAGTGKTRMAAVIARELHVPLLHIDASNLENGFLAGGSNTLKALQRRARKLGRCVVFIDEGQTLLAKRGQNDRSLGKHADDTANTLLSILDGVDRHQDGQALWIVATNFDDLTMAMDGAMSRRFGFKVNFRLPNLAERLRLLEVFFGRRAEHLAPELDLRPIAEVTAGLSPALLETISDKASMLAIQDNSMIATTTAMRAFERTTIGLTNRAMTADQEQARRIVAIHELGHFFAQFGRWHATGASLADIRGRLPVIKISTESLAKGESGALGFVLQKQEESPLKSRDDLEWDVVKLYGGAASEEIFFGKGRLTTGAFQDFQQSTRILKAMVADLSMYSETKVSYAVLLEGRASEALVGQVERVADTLYRRALAIVGAYRPLIEALTPVLLQRYTLTLDEALAAIAEHAALLPAAEAALPAAPVPVPA